MSVRPVNPLHLIIALAFGGASMFSVFAQPVTLDIQPRVIRLNESATLKLQFTNLNPAQAPGIPELPDFAIHYTGQEQHFQFVNGNQERRLSFNYRLVPRATGTFTVGPFSMELQGVTHEIAAVEVQVLPPSGGESESDGQTIDDLVFARLHVPRTDIYLQERFDVELHLYHRGVNLDRGIQLQNLPATGLNLEDFQEIGSIREVVNQEIYEVRRFRMRGTAITAGTFSLEPMVRVNVLVRRERQRDPFFGDFDFFFGRQEVQPLTVAARPVAVRILPLPVEDRPPEFNGAVGRFDMDMDIQPREVQAGDPVTLTLRITGQGNFENISMPALQFGDDFRRYDPKLIASGRDHKVFEQVFIPRSDAIRELPAVRFSYFDPEAAAFRTIERGPYPLVVKPGAATAPMMVQAPGGMSPPDRGPLGIDILDVKRQPEALRVSHSPSQTSLDVPTHTLPLLALVMLFLWQQRREAVNRDHTRRRRMQAPRSARKSLRRAETALNSADDGTFHQALWQALADYVGHRANLEPGEVSPALILQLCRKAGMNENQLQDLDTLMRECEEARFASSGAGDDPMRRKEQLQRTQDMLRTMEKVRLS